MKKYKSIIQGDLDIFVSYNEEKFEDEILKWNEIMIHGNPEGLRSFANLLIKLAEHDQDKDTNLPIGAKVHEHLRPNFELAKSSDTVIIGRLDEKGTGDYYERFIPRKTKQ